MDTIKRWYGLKLPAVKHFLRIGPDLFFLMSEPVTYVVQVASDPESLILFLVLKSLPEKLSLPCGHRFAVHNQYCGTRQRKFCRAWRRGITAKQICTAKLKKSARQINTHGKTYRKHTAHLRHSAKKLCRVFFYQLRQRI